MSFRSANSNSVPSNTLYSQVKITPWIRNKNWLTLPTVTSSDKTFVGLHAVWPDSNFVALNAAGNYYVDWGDGTNSTVSSGVQANHQYTYTDAALDGTNAPVTFQDTGDTVTRTSHGYVDGDIVSFYNIVSTSGITEAQSYYVINKSTNTFQISLTAGGSAISLTTNGSGTLLPYKQVIVVVTPQSGQTFSTINLGVKNSYSNLNSYYCSGFMDIIIAGTALSTITVSGGTVKFNMLEQAQIVSTTVASYASLFIYCSKLQSVPMIGNTSSGNTNMSNMFRDCKELQKVPYFNTSFVTNMSAMFTGDYSLIEVPLYNTHLNQNFNAMFRECYRLVNVPLYDMYSAIDLSYMFVSCSSMIECPPFKIPNTVTAAMTMFQNCSSLKTLPMLNFSKVVSLQYMFQTCSALISIPAFDCSSCTDFLSTFNSCWSLKTIPHLDTSKGTIFTLMFSNCYSLESIPDLDYHLATACNQMFDQCRSLKYIPTLNLPVCTNITTMFRGCYVLEQASISALGTITSCSAIFQDCYCLKKVELFSTSSATIATNMFANCYSLNNIPQFDMSSSTAFTSTFGSTCYSLTQGVFTSPKYTISYDGCNLSPTALTNIINSVGKPATAATLTLTNNWGNPTAVSLSAAAVDGSTTMLMASTTGLTVGMEFLGVGSALTIAAAVTLQDTGDTVTRTAHGLSNGDEVSFATLVTTTGISINIIYFVINATTNTFRLALTAGGSAIVLTTDGSGTIRYRQIISTINTNVSVILNRPATNTNTSSKTFHALEYGTALLRGWTVTG